MIILCMISSNPAWSVAIIQQLRKDEDGPTIIKNGSTSIYEDILDPVIRESIKRKKQSTSIRDSAQQDDEKYLNNREIIWTGALKIKEKESLGQTNNILSNILSPKTQKKVGEGIQIIHSAIPNYQILLLYIVYVIGGTVVMSLPGLL